MQRELIHDSLMSMLLLAAEFSQALFIQWILRRDIHRRESEDSGASCDFGIAQLILSCDAVRWPGWKYTEWNRTECAVGRLQNAARVYLHWVHVIVTDQRGTHTGHIGLGQSVWLRSTGRCHFHLFEEEIVAGKLLCNFGCGSTVQFGDVDQCVYDVYGSQCEQCIVPSNVKMYVTELSV